MPTLPTVPASLAGPRLADTPKQSLHRAALQRAERLARVLRRGQAKAQARGRIPAEEMERRIHDARRSLDVER